MTDWDIWVHSPRLPCQRTAADATVFYRQKNSRDAAIPSPNEQILDSASSTTYTGQIRTNAFHASGFGWIRRTYAKGEIHDDGEVEDGAAGGEVWAWGSIEMET